jgi:hypothetical protein
MPSDTATAGVVNNQRFVSDNPLFKEAPLRTHALHRDTPSAQKATRRRRA